MRPRDSWVLRAEPLSTSGPGPESSPGRGPSGGLSRWIRTMRNADSLLLAFSDEEIAAGLERLAGYCDDYLLGPTRLGLAAFQAEP